MSSKYYDNKENAYYNSTREDIFRTILKLGKFKSVLDIGCGKGELLKELKKNGLAEKIVGVEPFSPPESFEGFSSFHNCTVEKYFNQENKIPQFDLIIFSDVLEHLVDPWEILKYAVQNNLQNNGIVVISVPNFRNVFTLGSIMLFNSFKYQQAGVFDKTHLRFFCLKDLKELILSAGLLPLTYTVNFKEKKAFSLKRNRMKLLNILTFNLFPYWISDQIIGVGRKSSR